MDLELPRPDDDGAPTAPRPRARGRFRTNMRGLIVIVACFGLISWIARGIWVSLDPTRAAVSQVRSGWSTDREDAARRLGVLGLKEPDAAIPPLIDAMADGPPAVRTESARALGNFLPEAIRAGSAREATRAAVAALIRSLKDPDPAVRMAATSSLSYTVEAKGSGGSIALQSIANALVGRLVDGDDQVRLVAIAGLGQCGRAGLDAPPASLQAALEDQSASTRAAAIKALACLRYPLDPWLPYLLRTMERHEPEVRAACGIAFAREKPPAFSPAAIPALLEALEDRSLEDRSGVVTALIPHASDPRTAAAIPTLLRLLQKPIDRGRDRAGKGDAMSEVSWWNAPVPVCRLLARVAPGTPKAGEVITGLIEVIRDGDHARRRAALGALVEFGPVAEPAIPMLIRMWRKALKEPDAESSGNVGGVASALSQLAPRSKLADEALSALIEALDPRRKLRPGLRQIAIDALPAFGAEAARALPRLRVWRSDPDFGLSSFAGRAVKAIERDTASSKGKGNPRP